MGVFASALRLKRLAAKPAAGSVPSGADALYFKTDGKLYSCDSGGTERPVGQRIISAFANSSFETVSGTVPANWKNLALSGATWASDATTFVSGTRSVKHSTTTTSGSAMLMESPEFTVVPEATYSFGVFARGTSTAGAPQMQLGVETSLATDTVGMYQPGGTYVGISGGAVAVSPTWTYYEYQYVIPANHRKAVVRLTSNASVATTASVWYDDVSVEILSSPVMDDTGWITPTLLNGWAKVSATPQYRRMNGVTYLRGTLIGGAAMSTAFTLPVGFRSGGDGLRVANWGSATGHMSGTWITPQGEVKPYWLTPGGAEISIDNISFPADA